MSSAIRRFSTLAIAAALVFPILACAQHPAPVDVSKFTVPIRVSCVGDSITEGYGADGGPWPVQLAQMLGASWDVKNFGVSGTTLMNSGDNPYQKQGAFESAKAFNPDVVVIMLGTNDTKPQNWKYFAKDFEADYRDVINQFKALPSTPRIFLCLPPYIAKGGNWGINDPDTLKEFPVIKKLGRFMKLGVIDVHASLKGKDDLIPDNVHPNREGQTEITKVVFKALTGKDGPDAK